MKLKLIATSDNIKNEFGESSETFIASMDLMTQYYSKISGECVIQTSYKQWEKFLSLAYGKFIGNTKVFLVHTYLSVFSKILAFSILSKDKEFIEDQELETILNGHIFDDYRIENFVANDFYHWIATEANYKALHPVFRKILQTLENFDFSNIQEDILKGVYQELIDIETRHKLGEYYTPDWLCNEIIDSFEIKRDSKFLDPACGSGSFIRAFIHKLKKLYPKITAEEILAQVSGIDIHPLSLQIAKTNVLLEIYDLIKKTKKPIEMKLYLKNALSLPEKENPSFDFIGGNPPWLTYSMFSNKEYQEILSKLAGIYELIPSAANMPHLEIASIFLSHASEKFLKPNGKIAFVLPRSFLSADQHKNFRTGTSVGFNLTSIWDLNNVKPLFNVPAMVAFAEKESKKEKCKFPKSGISGIKFSGNGVIHKSEVTWYYSTLGERTALSDKKGDLTEGKNFYEPYFKQGANIVPRNFYFIDVAEVLPKKKAGRDGRVVIVKTAEHVLADAKPPWKEFILKDRLNTNFIFTTAMSKSILPFALINPVLVALPIVIERVGKRKEIRLLDADKVLAIGDYYSSKYFQKAENLWDKYKTEKNENISISDYLNWQNKLTGQDINSKYLVLYNASAKDANAVVLERRKFDFPFIVESAAYWYATDDKDEAIYLCAFLNSNFANKQIKDFQARGLFGPRHVSKTILQVPLPQFNPTTKIYKTLSDLGESCIQKTTDFLSHWDTKEVSSLKLGNLRLKIREHLYKELNEIDKVLGNLIPNPGITVK
ncbi:MAG: SAM-dependent DNA methyltransferase [Leptospiraceae bacterium]|nr:SAM-dependent DNA methyltransferase [Leptospiraceae bacterium]